MENHIKTNLDTNYLKIIAIITMTIDHVGFALFPNVLALRIIGRIAFPLFAYCVMLGSVYTKNIWKYFFRLAFCALLYQLVYHFFVLPFWQDYILSYNIFFTLTIGLFGIICLQKNKPWLLPLVLLFSYYLGADYGLGGVLLIISFYAFRNRPLILALVVIPQLLYMQTERSFVTHLNIQSYSALCLPFIFLPTDFQFKINKYFFYLFYPVHLLVIYLISLLL